MLLLYIFWDDWPIFMIPGSIVIHPTHSWWISEIQSGREDTLEERYAIKLCFKLGKNATETYGMLQTTFRPSCMNRASIFEWHQRFKECMESVWDDERCEKSKEVRTPELIGQIKNFMDKDRRVSIETLSAHFDVSVGTLRTIIHEELKMRKICAKFVQRMHREDQKEKRCQSSWSIQISKFFMLWWPAMKAGSTAMTQRPIDRVPSGSMLALPDPRRPDRANLPTNFSWSLFCQHWHDVHALRSHWTVNREYYVEVLREFRKRFLGKRPELFKSGQWHFHQDNAPVHNSILVIDYLTKMGIKTVPQPPYSPDLAPCDF